MSLLKPARETSFYKQQQLWFKRMQQMQMQASVKANAIPSSHTKNNKNDNSKLLSELSS